VVVVKLMGGLGNQLFQYSAGKALSERHKTELVLDDSWYVGPFFRNTPRIVGLRSLNIAARLPTLRERAWMRTCSSGVLSRFPLPRPWRVIKESHYHFDPRFPNLPDDVYLSGYWQSEQYFDERRSSLLKELTPRGASPPSLHDWVAAVASTESVSIHIRRGDFVANARTAAYHGALPLTYYEAAVAHAASRIANPTFFVFSDDIAWARENLRLRHVTTFVQQLSSDPCWEMLLMSRCRHHIIANSSYSWWGAWLNPSKDSIVVAPRRWFQDPRIDTADLIPRRWHRI
jgi:hypothetical protein